MTEYHHNPSPRGRLKRVMSGASTGLVVLGLFIIFVIAVLRFRHTPEVTSSVQTPSIAQVFRPDPVSQAVVNDAIDTQSREATLRLLSGSSVGTVHRGTKDERYFLEITSDLPMIDREQQHYEGWLLRPIPYDFFSVGEMVTDDEGRFIVQWQGEEDKDYSGYVQVIVTLQSNGGSSDPQAHIAEATFGK
ncbi:hypothetical protein HZA85_00995 [Candidatus Uhrbacteria bacterium]|nr:hypothetical protein [Candidatus Uhrbacteria bacterium]